MFTGAVIQNNIVKTDNTLLSHQWLMTNPILKMANVMYN